MDFAGALPVVYGYFDIDLDVLWDVISLDITRLAGQVRSIRERRNQRSG